MRTRVIKINRNKPEIKKIEIAARMIRRGELVAFPTETVYGLGANALDANAVKKIFKTKKRPFDDPIIVHVADVRDVEKIVKHIPKKAEKLMKKFWSGPLTIVMKKKRNVPDEVTAGLETVAVRMPKNKIASDLIKQSGVPIAAPSANIFGRTSPTSADHVFQDLRGKIGMIIDGGRTTIGLESTVIDLTSRIPTVLRPGGVTREQIESEIGRVKIHDSVLRKKKIVSSKSPGMKYKHYAPKAELILLEGDREDIENKRKELISNFRSQGKKVGIILFEKGTRHNYCVIRYLGKNPQKVGRNLFSVLREFDKMGVDVIISEAFEQSGLGLAISDRMRKAASRIISCL